MQDIRENTTNKIVLKKGTDSIMIYITQNNNKKPIWEEH